MDPIKVLLLALLTLAVLSSSMVDARPRGQAAMAELTDIASNMAHTLDEVMDMLTSSQRARSRRRRMVQFHIGRQHHSPRHRYRRGRRLRYRKQRASRNPNISDH